MDSIQVEIATIILVFKTFAFDAYKSSAINQAYERKSKYKLTASELLRSNIADFSFSLSTLKKSWKPRASSQRIKKSRYKLTVVAKLTQFHYCTLTDEKHHRGESPRHPPPPENFGSRACSTDFHEEKAAFRRSYISLRVAKGPNHRCSVSKRVAGSKDERGKARPCREPKDQTISSVVGRGSSREYRQATNRIGTSNIA